jgi:hypothetical protein
MPSPRLDETEFKSRFRAQFKDRNFDFLTTELDAIAQAAWDAYEHQRKSPPTVKAAPGYADPDSDLADDRRRLPYIPYKKERKHLSYKVPLNARTRWSHQAACPK